MMPGGGGFLGGYNQDVLQAEVSRFTRCIDHS